MTRKQRFAAVAASAGALVALIVGVCARQAVGQSASSQAYALADLVAGVIDCSVHPCFGDSEEEIRELLRGQILENDCSEFSDLAVVYPSASRALQGVVELDPTVEFDEVYLMLTEFHAPAALVVAELERVLPDCEMELEEEEDETNYWVCEIELEEPEELTLDVDVSFAPGLAFLVIE